MPQTTQLIDDLVSKIDSTINSFNSSIPAIQKDVYDELQLLLKDLQIDGGRLKGTVENFNAIGKLKSKIENIILSPDYVNKVVAFTNAYNAISTLNNKYFASLVSDYKAPAVLRAIKNDAVNATVSSLTESGINANLTTGIEDILRRNIRAGGKYTDLADQMRDFLTTNDTGDGALVKYTRRITTDSLNQFSATYHQAITSDLGLEWFMYVGSNLRTTRPFCKFLTEKKYIHISELPEILNGHIDGHNVFINPKTGTWAGGIPGTNVDNFSINRGGYNCGHQLIGVTKEMVPADIRARFESKEDIRPITD